MTEQVALAFRPHNPDVLTCIANLSNDEVFTPPELANQMLDTVADAWAESNNGANIWADPTVRFLDPFTKSGVFLREITARLVEGLEDEIPDRQARVDHVLSKQVFGIGITNLTALLARRSVYCSKYANGKKSIATVFDTEAGNIWFERTEHTWEKRKRVQRVHPTTGVTEIVEESGTGRCKFCGAPETSYDRGGMRESHAYAFIHTDNIKARIAELFGDDMQFDVIIGNPPYQLGESGGEAVGKFAMPIYQRFIEVAKALEPRSLTMITPSRWFAGGRGLADFRNDMLSDRRVRKLVDFPDSREVFDGVDISGGVSYFHWDSSWDGPCEIQTSRGGKRSEPMSRSLDEFDILVRYNEAISVLHRVMDVSSGQRFSSLARKVSPIQPFSIRTSFRGATSRDGMDDPVEIYQNGGVGFVERSAIPRNGAWVDRWKVLLSGAASEHGGQADSSGKRRVFSKIIVAPPGTACTETYLVVSLFDFETAAENMAAYLRTKFVRFLVSLRTNTQHLYSERFAFVPDLPMDKQWTDEELYAKYGLSEDEIEFIESQIKPMELSDD